MTFHDVIALFDGAGIDMRKAYWGHPQRPDCCNGLGDHTGTDGDLEFVIVVDGGFLADVASVEKVGNQIRVSVV